MLAQIALTAPAYAANLQSLAVLSPDERARFEDWMRELDAEHARRGAPYGDGSLSQTTGAKCWLYYFLENYDPVAALKADAENFDAADDRATS